MIAKLIAWIIELFRSKPKKQRDLEQDVKELKDEVKEIEDEDISITDINDHFNK